VNQLEVECGHLIEFLFLKKYKKNIFSKKKKKIVATPRAPWGRLGYPHPVKIAIM
jgi:hypothetical protein